MKESYMIEDLLNIFNIFTILNILAILNILNILTIFNHKTKPHSSMSGALFVYRVPGLRCMKNNLANNIKMPRVLI